MAKTRPPVRALLDSCCFLVFITGQDPDADTAQHILGLIDDKAIQLVESPSILVEVPPTHATDHGDGKRYLIRGLLESADVEYVDLTSAVARRAGDYVPGYGLDPMDAIQLATAVHAGVDALVTLNTNDFPMDETVDGVRVLTPSGFLRRFFNDGTQPELDYTAARAGATPRAK